MKMHRNADTHAEWWVLATAALALVIVVTLVATTDPSVTPVLDLLLTKLVEMVIALRSGAPAA